MTILRAVAALAGLLVAAALHAQPLSPVEQFGRRLYVDGVDGKGQPIAGRVAGSREALRGKPVACGNCHGEDGRGRPESGVDPGDVTWPELSKPYGHLHGGKRRHGPFDVSSLRRALRDGVDPAGNRFDEAMPLYALSEADVDALVAYLKRLDTQRETGVSETELRIGTVLPASGALAEAGKAVQRVLEGYFDGINGRGGVHGRSLKLVVAQSGADGKGPGSAVQSMLRKDGVFALLAPLSAQNEREFAAAAEAAGAPVVGPLTLFPESATASSQVVFHVLPGVPELAEALAVHLHPLLALPGRTVVLLHSATEEGRTTAAFVEARLRARGYGAVAREAAGPPSELATRIARHEPGAVILLTPGADPSALARALAARGARPHWLLPGPLVPADILDWPREADGLVFASYPTLPRDRSNVGAVTLQAAAGRDAPRGHQAMQVAALASAVVLVEGLSRAGRDLSRPKFVAALEGLNGFETGLTPPVSYNADRRIGSYGAWIVRIQLEQRAFQPLPDFVRLQ